MIQEKIKHGNIVYQEGNPVHLNETMRRLSAPIRRLKTENNMKTTTKIFAQ